MKQEKILQVIAYVILSIVCFAAFFPIFWAIMMSLKTPGDWAAFPPKLISWPPDFVNYSWLYPPAFAAASASDSITNQYTQYAKLLNIPQNFLPNSFLAAIFSTLVSLSCALL